MKDESKVKVSQLSAKWESKSFANIFLLRTVSRTMSVVRRSTRVSQRIGNKRRSYHDSLFSVVNAKNERTRSIFSLEMKKYEIHLQYWCIVSSIRYRQRFTYLQWFLFFRVELHYSYDWISYADHYFYEIDLLFGLPWDTIAFMSSKDCLIQIWIDSMFFNEALHHFWILQSDFCVTL